MNKVYLKGLGDFEPEYQSEPTDEQIIRAIRDNPDAVAKNALSSFSMELTSALFIAAKFDDMDAVRDVLNKSAIDLMDRGEI